MLKGNNIYILPSAPLADPSEKFPHHVSQNLIVSLSLKRRQS
jgi:hypothetical protein